MFNGRGPETLYTRTLHIRLTTIPQYLVKHIKRGKRTLAFQRLLPTRTGVHVGDLRACAFKLNLTAWFTTLSVMSVKAFLFVFKGMSSE